jgi:class III poly(R)-hydroxyalkanoic acid synthase PhaE subunit
MQKQQQKTDINSLFSESIKTAQAMFSSRFLQINLENMAEFQDRWTKQLSALQGEKNEACPSDKKNHLDVILRWAHWFENETRQFLNIPQLGLTRQYQGNLNLAMEKYNNFQGRWVEFLCRFFEPVNKSLETLQNEIVESAEKRKSPEGSKQYYDQWIKDLEEQYMTLFNSSEYVRSLGETVCALDDFMKARSSVLEDVLKTIPVPTMREMDALYEDIYYLKKRIRDLEKNQPIKKGFKEKQHARD